MHDHFVIDSTPLHVLLAEDEPTQCLFVSRLLRRAGYVVNVVNDGEKALDEIAKGTYQMLVTDWDMPRLDGPTLCQRVRKLALPSYLYILILTGHSTTQSVVAGLDAGAIGHLGRRGRRLAVAHASRGHGERRIAVPRCLGDDLQHLRRRGLLLQRLGESLPGLSEFAGPDFELRFQLGQ